MKKMKFLKVMTLVAILSSCFIGCDSDDDNDANLKPKQDEVTSAMIGLWSPLKVEWVSQGKVYSAEEMQAYLIQHGESETTAALIALNSLTQYSYEMLTEKAIIFKIKKSATVDDYFDIAGTITKVDGEKNIYNATFSFDNFVGNKYKTKEIFDVEGFRNQKVEKTETGVKVTTPIGTQGNKFITYYQVK